MKRILCFGDSNTWGYISGSNHQRYNENERWTKLLQKFLGAEFEVIEEGLNSRTLCSQDKRKGKEFTNGFSYLIPCLQTHDKVDAVVLMLGTNELKFAYNNTPQNIFQMFLKYVDIITNYKSQIDGCVSKLIVCGVPPIDDTTTYCITENKFVNASKMRPELNNLMRDFCHKQKILFVDNSDLKVGIDGVHLTLESHKILAKKLEKLVLENLWKGSKNGEDNWIFNREI